MNLIFISIYLGIVLCSCSVVFLYIKLENLEKKQEKDHDHVLNNLRFITNLITNISKNEK